MHVQYFKIRLSVSTPHKNHPTPKIHKIKKPKKNPKTHPKQSKTKQTNKPHQQPKKTPNLSTDLGEYWCFPASWAF